VSANPVIAVNVKNEADDPSNEQGRRQVPLAIANNNDQVED
jgi:hypothetical protein